MTCRILIVEDSPTQAERLRLLLEGAGYQADVAPNGRAALRQIATAPPDLVISDITMPEMDGYALCQEVKGNRATQYIPVVLLTERKSPLDIIEGMLRGADNFLTKPFEDQYLLERVRRILEHLDLRRHGTLEVDIVLRLGGRDISLSADKQQIFELLFATFEELSLANTALRERERALDAKARELEVGNRTLAEQVLERTRAEEALRRARDELERRVHERTAELTQANAALRDEVAERKRVEAALRESEALFRSLFERHAAVKLLVDPDAGDIVDANDAAERFYGWPRERLKQMRIQDINTLPAEEVKAEMEKARAQARIHFEFRHRRADGSIRDVEVFSSKITAKGNDLLHSIVHDVSERKRVEREKEALEAQLRQQQKLEAIGTLASGVAHEINNPINGIMNYAQLIADTAAPESRAAEYAGEIIHETDRVATIVRNLLQFARQEQQTHSLARPADIVEQTLSLLRAVLRRDQIVLTVDVPEGLPPLKCRSQQLQQVLMNLLTNARDALNAKYPGYHTDKTIQVTVRRFEQAGRPWFRLIVADQGNGIPLEIQARIFDPFFTTKPRDQGTGLGLSISHGIVQDHHGVLHFETKPGQGTQFHVDLPVEEG